MSKRIGIPTTVPHEISFAAGHRAVDLNNLFVEDERAPALLDQAEREGFPPNICAWIKGIYAAVKRGRVDAVVAVLTGDCSNTRALAEVLAHQGVPIIPFSYPASPEPALVEAALQDFAHRLGVELSAAEAVRRQWRPLRRHLAELDRLAWEENKISSRELHTWLVSASDFGSEPERFAGQLQEFLLEADKRRGAACHRRLALLGVPPIFTDLFEIVDQHEARLIFTEVPRQFAMPYQCTDLVEQFCRYTYPYDLAHRLGDLENEIARRRANGVINYLQAFCHRQIEAVVLRDKLRVPMLALEGDRPGPLSGQGLTRLEAFLEMLP